MPPNTLQKLLYGMQQPVDARVIVTTCPMCLVINPTTNITTHQLGVEGLEEVQDSIILFNIA